MSDGDRMCADCGDAPPAHQRTICEGCRSARRRRARSENPEVERARKREWWANNRSRIASQRKAKYKADPDPHKRQSAEYRNANRDKALQSTQDWRKKHPDRAKSANQRVWRSKQSETLEVAERNGTVWAGWELEMVADSTRPLKELALQLGRTYAAVSIRRHMVNHDPATIQRAGIAEDTNREEWR